MSVNGFAIFSSLRDCCFGDFWRLCQYSRWVRGPRVPMHSRAAIHRNVTVVSARNCSARRTLNSSPLRRSCRSFSVQPSPFLPVVPPSASLGHLGQQLLAKLLVALKPDTAQGLVFLVPFPGAPGFLVIPEDRLASLSPIHQVINGPRIFHS